MKTKKEILREINAMYPIRIKRNYYDKEKAKENYQEKKKLELIKHKENCREENCPLKWKH